MPNSSNGVHVGGVRKKDGPVLRAEVLQIQVRPLPAPSAPPHTRPYSRAPRTHLVRLGEEVPREEADVRLLEARREDDDVRGEGSV